MGSVLDTLWQLAKQEPMGDRPLKMDVKSVAEAVDPGEQIQGVFGARFSFATIAVLVITSDALLLGQSQPGRILKDLLKMSPEEFRRNDKVLAIPRNRIASVQLAPDRIDLYTDVTRFSLPVAAGNRSGAMVAALLSLGQWAPGAAPGTAQPPAPPAMPPTPPPPPTRAAPPPPPVPLEPRPTRQHPGLPPLELPRDRQRRGR